MADIVFYEKPGCVNGGKQKKILENAGHTLECRNILEYPWTYDELLLFVKGKTPGLMMNWTAPVIKKGELNPEDLSFSEAMEKMLEDPILIKRPLIIVDGSYIQGFVDPALDPYLGDWKRDEDVTTCPKLQTLSCDEEAAGLAVKK